MGFPHALLASHRLKWSLTAFCTLPPIHVICKKRERLKTLYYQARGVIDQQSSELVREECIAVQPPTPVMDRVNAEARELTDANDLKRALERCFAVLRSIRLSDLALVP